MSILFPANQLQIEGPNWQLGDSGARVLGASSCDGEGCEGCIDCGSCRMWWLETVVHQSKQRLPLVESTAGLFAVKKLKFLAPAAFPALHRVVIVYDSCLPDWAIGNSIGLSIHTLALF